MALKNNNYVTFIELKLINKGPLRIGDDDSILIDSVTNSPYVPGTSIAGVLRSYATKNYKKQEVEMLFGGSEKESNLMVFDTTIKNSREIEFRPSVRIDGKTGTNLKGGFFEREYLSKGSEINIKFKLYSKDLEKLEKNTEILYSSFNALNKGVIRIGGHKTNGAGIVEVKDVKEATLNLTNKKELAQYLSDKYELKSVKDKVYKINIKDNYINFHINCETSTPILVKGKDSLNSNLPDGAGIQDAYGNYIIPGSSLKGTFRNGFGKIAKFKELEELIEFTFGKVTDKEDEEHSGRLFFEDVEIRNSKDEAIYNRIKIDKFTSSVAKGALLNDRPVIGNLRFNINYELSGKEEDFKVIPLVLFTLKDLLEGYIKIGSGASVGRGSLVGSKIEFNMNGELNILDLKGDNHVNKEGIESLIKNLKN